MTPPGFGPSLEEMLLEHPRGRIWLRRHAISAWDVIRREFESRHVRAFMCWQAFQTLVPLDAAGSGTLAYSIIFGRQRRSWSIPRGGSGALTQALVALPRGPRRRRSCATASCPGSCSRTAAAPASVTEDGERYMARTRGALDDPREGAREAGAGRGVGRGVPLRRRDVRRRHVGHGGLLRDGRGAGLRDAGRPDRAPCRRAPSAGRRRCSSWAGRCATGARTTTACRGCSSPRPRSIDPDRAPGGAPHGQAALAADLGPAGRRRELGRAQGDARRPPARARAPLHPGPLRRAHPRALREEPRGHPGGRTST